MLLEALHLGGPISPISEAGLQTLDPFKGPGISISHIV